MAQKLFLQVDQLASLKFETDTSVLLAQAAAKDGFEVYTYEPKDLSYLNNRVVVKASKTEFTDTSYQVSETRLIDLENEATLVLIRQNPPFNMDYITYCYLLSTLSVPVFNPPKILINNPEKLIPFHFQDLMAPTLISKDIEQIISFTNEHGKVVVKPLYSFGGNEIFLVEGLTPEIISKISSLLDMPIIVQKLIPEISTHGDIRILMSLDKILSIFTRIPKPGSIISNLASGGTPQPIELNEYQQQACVRIGEFLKDNKIILAGIDMIGNYVTEVNITSPTGIKIANNMFGKQLHFDIWNNIKSLTDGILK